MLKASIQNYQYPSSRPVDTSTSASMEYMGSPNTRHSIATNGYRRIDAATVLPTVPTISLQRRAESLRKLPQMLNSSTISLFPIKEPGLTSTVMVGHPTVGTAAFKEAKRNSRYGFVNSRANGHSPQSSCTSSIDSQSSTVSLGSSPKHFNWSQYGMDAELDDLTLAELRGLGVSTNELQLTPASLVRGAHTIDRRRREVPMEVTNVECLHHQLQPFALYGSATLAPQRNRKLFVVICDKLLPRGLIEDCFCDFASDPICSTTISSKQHLKRNSMLVESKHIDPNPASIGAIYHYSHTIERRQPPHSVDRNGRLGLITTHKTVDVSKIQQSPYEPCCVPRHNGFYPEASAIPVLTNSASLLSSRIEDPTARKATHAPSTARTKEIKISKSVNCQNLMCDRNDNEKKHNKDSTDHISTSRIDKSQKRVNGCRDYPEKHLSDGPRDNGNGTHGVCDNVKPRVDLQDDRSTALTDHKQAMSTDATKHGATTSNWSFGHARSLEPVEVKCFLTQKRRNGEHITTIGSVPTNAASGVDKLTSFTQAVQRDIHQRINEIVTTCKVKSNFKRHYEIEKFVRSGGFSDIYEGRRLSDKSKVILKFIPKHKTKNWLMVKGQRFPSEVLLHKAVSDLQGVLNLFDYFEEEDCWIIVIECLPLCCDLFDYMERMRYGRLNESQARNFFTQLVSANVELACRGVVHRDIKSENVLLDVENNRLVLIDFGASAIFQDEPYSDFHGTRQFSTPEYIVKAKYYAGPSTVWALGVLLYDMVVGRLPFENEADILSKDVKIWTSVSNPLRLLIHKCLQRNPELRPKLKDLLKDPWVTQPIQCHMAKSCYSERSPADTETSHPSKREQAHQPDVRLSQQISDLAEECKTHHLKQQNGLPVYYASDNLTCGGALPHNGEAHS